MNELNATVQNPSLTLYAFHLCRSFSQEPNQLLPEADALWEAITQLSAPLNSPMLEGFKQELVSPEVEQQAEYKVLLKDNRTHLELDFAESTELQGSICPYQLHDVYAVDLTLAKVGQTPLEYLPHLNPQGALSLPLEKTSLGQTLVLYAESSVSNSEYEVLAKQCVHKILHESNESIDLVAKGTLLNGSAFEFRNGNFESSQARHILVCLIPHPQPADQMDEVFKRLLLILCCRHKILYAYRQSRSCDCQAKVLYSKLESHLSNIHQISQHSDHLQRFKQILIDLPLTAIDYARYLRDLSDHETTIATNITNYKKEFNKLTKIPGNENLYFLQKFLEQAKNRLLPQIRIDQKYLSPGRDLFQQVIDTIRGLTEIEQTELNRQQAAIEKQREIQQAESDRQQAEIEKQRENRLQLTLAFFAVGFAVSGISSQVIPTPIETLQGQDPAKLPAPELVKLNSLDILIHIAIGILAGTLAVATVSMWNRFYKRCKFRNDS